jgi:hypothetical protein
MVAYAARTPACHRWHPRPHVRRTDWQVDRVLNGEIKLDPLALLQLGPQATVNDVRAERAGLRV